MTSKTWKSSALRRLRIPAGPAQRVPILTATLAWEQNVVNEPLVWFYGGRWHMIYTGGWSSEYLGYAICDGDPMVPANWTKSPTPTLGRDAATGFTGTIAHAGYYIEGTTLYVYFSDLTVTPTVLRVASSPLAADPPTWTVGGAVLTRPSGLPNPGWMANVFMVKDTTQTHAYTLFYESQANGWQIGVAVGDSPTGTFTVLTSELQSIKPFPGAACSNPWVELENGEYVAYFHAGPQSSTLPTQVYRAHAVPADLTRDGWRLDNQSRPVIRRAHRYEVDQVADICLVRADTTSPRIAFWSALDNTAPLGAIMGAVTLPTEFAWNGTTWVDQTPGVDLTPGVTTATQPVTVELAADQTVTGAATTILSTTFTPVGTSLLAEFNGFGSNTTAGANSKLQLKVGATVKALGQVTQGAAGAQFPVAGRAQFTGLTPGAQVTVELQAAATTGTFQCRPSTQAGVEGCALTVQDAARWPAPN